MHSFFQVLTHLQKLHVFVHSPEPSGSYFFVFCSEFIIVICRNLSSRSLLSCPGTRTVSTFVLDTSGLRCPSDIPVEMFASQLDRHLEFWGEIISHLAGYRWRIVIEMDKTNQDRCIHVKEKHVQNQTQVHSRVHDEEELAKQIKKGWTVRDKNPQESVVLKSS